MISLSIKSRKDLFMAKNNTNTKQGFTIIEVVLVLAIAGLIFLMVFVALPALQRSQRDTARRNDLSRVDTSLVQYQTNNSTKVKNLPDAGTMAPQNTSAFPASCDTACSFVRNYMNSGTADNIDVNEFQDPDGTWYGMTIQDFDTTYTASGRFNYQTVAGTNAMNHIIYVLTGAKCDGEEAIHDTSRHFAILYRLEGAGTYCIDDQ